MKCRSFMGANNIILLESLEWLDDTGQELLHRLPEHGSGEIKYGAQLTVRESQAAVLFYRGRAGDVFPAGRHTLKTANIPILTKILSAPWGMTSPLRAEVYFVNLKVFTNLKWGTRDPVAFRDSELGLVRLRAHGVFNIRVVQPVLFINTLAGTMGKFTTRQVEEYLRRVIVSRFNDHLGEHLQSLLDLPGSFDALAAGLRERLVTDFYRFGLMLDGLYITSITPPPEVQEAIDDQSRLQVIGDMDRFVHMKAAMAMEEAARQGEGSGAGIGLGMGMLIPGLFGSIGTTGKDGMPPVVCPDCARNIAPDARFCPYCGHQQVILQQCAHCGKNLTPGSRFCPRCGKPVDAKPHQRVCPHCRKNNLPDARFCNSCGKALQ